MRIVKVSRDAFPEINPDDFNRQQKQMVCRIG